MKTIVQSPSHRNILLEIARLFLNARIGYRTFIACFVLSLWVGGLFFGGGVEAGYCSLNSGITCTTDSQCKSYVNQCVNAGSKNGDSCTSNLECRTAGTCDESPSTGCFGNSDCPYISSSECAGDGSSCDNDSDCRSLGPYTCYFECGIQGSGGSCSDAPSGTRSCSPLTEKVDCSDPVWGQGSCERPVYDDGPCEPTGGYNSNCSGESLGTCSSVLDNDYGTCILVSCSSTPPTGSAGKAKVCTDGGTPTTTNQATVLSASCSGTTACDWTCDAWHTYDSGSGTCVPKQFACGETFTDSGGPSGDYTASSNQVRTICPVGSNDFVEINLASFNVESASSCSRDSLKIYNGDSTSAALIGTYCGTTAPGIIGSTHSSGCLTFEFKSDSSVQRPGWSTPISCISRGFDGECAAFNSPPYASQPALNTAQGCALGDFQEAADTQIDRQWKCLGGGNGGDVLCKAEKETCGNGTCDAGSGETCATCVADCGSCTEPLCVINPATVGQPSNSAEGCVAGTFLEEDDITKERRRSCNSNDGTSKQLCSMPKELGVCGNGIVEVGEECDDSNLNPSDDCTSECMIARCGDGFIQSGVEECDRNEGCNTSCQRVDPACTLSVAPNTIFERGTIATFTSTHDDSLVGPNIFVCGNNLPRCGDGVVDFDGDDNELGTSDDEQCDDGNTANNDGCSSSCVFDVPITPDGPQCDPLSVGSCRVGTSQGFNGSLTCGSSTWSCLEDGKTIGCSRFLGHCPERGVCNNGLKGGCLLGTLNGYSLDSNVCEQLSQWTCSGLYGGADSPTCSFVNAPCPINGTCNNSVKGGCGVVGSTPTYITNTSACSQTSTWTCSGLYGGNPSSQCSLANPTCPVASCGSVGACGPGDSKISDNNASSCDTTRTWVCSESNAGYTDTRTCTNYNGSCCTPSCGGNECGPNGCGGSCGSCSGDEVCNGGTCEPPIPTCSPGYFYSYEFNTCAKQDNGYGCYPESPVVRTGNEFCGTKQKLNDGSRKDISYASQFYCRASGPGDSISVPDRRSKGYSISSPLDDSCISRGTPHIYSGPHITPYSVTESHSCTSCWKFPGGGSSTWFDEWYIDEQGNILN